MGHPVYLGYFKSHLKKKEFLTDFNFSQRFYSIQTGRYLLKFQENILVFKGQAIHKLEFFHLEEDTDIEDLMYTAAET